MPTDIAIVVAVLVFIFAIFAAAMAWADIYTRDCRTAGAKYFDSREKKA